MTKTRISVFLLFFSVCCVCSCVPKSEALLVNFSGENKLITTDGFERYLKDGNSDKHSPLIEVKENRILKAKNCPENAYAINRCTNIPWKTLGDYNYMVRQIKEYKKIYGVTAAYFIDKDNDIVLKPYNKPSKKISENKNN